MKNLQAHRTCRKHAGVSMSWALLTASLVRLTRPVFK